MKKILYLVAIFCAIKANAQNYLITFAGAGTSSSVNTVKVENLTAGTSLTLNGNDILHLTGITDINPVENEQLPGMKIYPNPMIDNSTVEVFPPVAGDAIITVYDITGKSVTQIHSYLEKNRQEFKLSGTKNGFYLINVTSNNYQFSGKLLCKGKSNGTLSIEKVSNDIQTDYEKISEKDYKGVQVNVDMPYSTGDRLKFTGISGIYSTVITDIPSSDKTITFNFIVCTDGDNNNYPVVQIGQQTWMAENLKTTRNIDGSIIPNITGNSAWDALNSPGFCWYSNDIGKKNVYGALYNWYTAISGNLCPAGWHVPTDAEWIILTTYLGGEILGGGKLKESGTSHWNNPNTQATNETGFTALPGGYRYIGGAFAGIGSNGEYWSSSQESSSIYVYNRYMQYNTGNINRSINNKQNGFSVRCVKD
jgi:uncharacterized protein (TIGR02145 family)